MEIKPCPFCGNGIIRVFEYPWQKEGLKGNYLYCHKCGARAGKHETIEQAIEAWNMRKEKKHE